MRGRVKWFSAEKGWGFISVDGQRDVFVHHTAIESPGYRSLREGEEVEFELVQGERGPYAARVVRQAENG